MFFVTLFRLVEEECSPARMLRRGVVSVTKITYSRGHLSYNWISIFNAYQFFGFGNATPLFVREVTLFGDGREFPCAPLLRAPDSCNALCLMGALDLGGLRIAAFCDDPTE